LTLHHVSAIYSRSTNLDEHFTRPWDRYRPTPGHQDVYTAGLTDLDDSHRIPTGNRILEHTHEFASSVLRSGFSRPPLRAA
jgi:hypothetical protein